MNNVLIKFELGNQSCLDATRLLNAAKRSALHYKYVQLRH